MLAESYEKIHKDHLVGIGIAPLQFLPGESAGSLGLSGRETFSVTFPAELSPGVTLNVKVLMRVTYAGCRALRVQIGGRTFRNSHFWELRAGVREGA